MPTSTESPCGVRHSCCSAFSLPYHIHSVLQEETVLHRLEVYHAETEPIIDHFKNQGLVQTFSGTESNVIYPRLKVCSLRRGPVVVGVVGVVGCRCGGMRSCARAHPFGTGQGAGSDEMDFLIFRIPR